MNLDYVKFDVGHYLYLSHKSTLLKFEDSVLAKYVSSQFDRRKSADDYIVIDRDGKHFGKILNYMRDQSSLDLKDWKEGDLVDLMREADFYCLTQLVEFCERQLEIKSSESLLRNGNPSSSVYKPPENHKLEIIYELDTLKGLLNSSNKPTIVISYRTMRKLHIDSWIEELVKLCDYSRYRMFCYANKGDAEKTCDGALIDFIMSLYNPEESRFSLSLSAPDYNKFRDKRDYYKCKIFKLFLLIQNGWTSTSKRKQLK